MEPDPNLIVGTDTFDDAGVYKLSDEIALVQTVDFFTPVVDDPFLFGQIAAANALSDIYAMGGRPVTALNLVSFPKELLDRPILSEILRGGMTKIIEAGACLAGGHTVDDPEPKYGLSVTGVVHPDKVVRNAGARPGDRLILTKPLGVGVITTALRRVDLDPAVLAGAVEAMTTLNRAAAEAMQSVGAHACTDITGFGFLGHLYEMASGSGVGATIRAGSVPILEGARELAEEGYICGGSRANLSHLEPHVAWADEIDPVTRILLADAITSGGLLIAVDPAKAERLLAELEAGGVPLFQEVGEITAEEPGRIRVVS